MTSRESRRQFIESQFSEKELEQLKKRGFYQDYVEGKTSICTICNQIKDQGI